MKIRIFIFGLFLIILVAGCNSSSNNSSSRTAVTVTNNAGAKLSGVAVVLGDSEGAMKATGITNANGEATFPVAQANATVTAAYSCLYSGSTFTYYSLDVQYDVNEPVTLAVNDCSIIGPPAANAIGTITVNVTNALSGIAITQNELSTNRSIYYGFNAIISQLSFSIYPYDLQYDGKLSIYVIGRDANGLTVGYGMIQDQTFTDGMTVNITVDKPVSFVQYQITNLPLDANRLCTGLNQLRSWKGGVWIDDCRNLSSSSTETTIAVAYIPGLGDQFQYSVDAFVDSSSSNGWVGSGQYLAIAPSAVLSDQNIDFSQALAAPSDLSVAGSDTVTPELIWTGLDPAADVYFLSAAYHLASGYIGSFYIDYLSPARASIKFPELPDSLAAFRPQAVESFGIGCSASSNDGSFRFSYSSKVSMPPASPQLQFLQRKGMPASYPRHAPSIPL